MHLSLEAARMVRGELRGAGIAALAARADEERRRRDEDAAFITAQHLERVAPYALADAPDIDLRLLRAVARQPNRAFDEYQLTALLMVDRHIAASATHRMVARGLLIRTAADRVLLHPPSALHALGPVLILAARAL